MNGEPCPKDREVRPLRLSQQVLDGFHVLIGLEAPFDSLHRLVAMPLGSMSGSCSATQRQASSASRPSARKTTSPLGTTTPAVFADKGPLKPMKRQRP